MGFFCRGALTYHRTLSLFGRYNYRDFSRKNSTFQNPAKNLARNGQFQRQAEYVFDRRKSSVQYVYKKTLVTLCHTSSQKKAHARGNRARQINQTRKLVMRQKRYKISLQDMWQKKFQQIQKNVLQKTYRPTAKLTGIRNILAPRRSLAFTSKSLTIP